VYSRPLAPSQFTCSSLLQDSTPQLSNKGCTWQPSTRNSRPHGTATYLVNRWPFSTLIRTTLASRIECSSQSVVTTNWLQQMFRTKESTIRVTFETIGSLSPLLSKIIMKYNYHWNVRPALRHNTINYRILPMPIFAHCIFIFLSGIRPQDLPLSLTKPVTWSFWNSPVDITLFCGSDRYKFNG
jgi:hypothetical protein